MAHAWDAAQVARAAGGRLLHPALGDARAARAGPCRHRLARGRRPGTSSSACAASTPTAARFALGALEAGAWGVLVADEHAEALVRGPDAEPGGAVVAAADPLAALAALARAWRRHLGCPVVGITGSTGKTSTKDVLAAMLALDRCVVATPRNWNTEIGLPLTVLSAPEGTEALVLEMAMRGAGQIAELARIAEPDVGLVTNVGPVHLEQLGTIDAIADEKTALLRGLRGGGTAVVPADDDLVRSRVPMRRAHGDLRARRRRRRAPGRPRARVHERPHAPQRPRRAGRRPGRGGAAARPRGRRAAASAAASARSLADGRRRRGRLLQRQPDVDARRPRRPRGVGAGPSGRRPRGHARARRRRAGLPRAGRCPRRDRRRRPPARRRPARRMRRPRPSAPRRPPARRSTTCPTPRRPPRPRPCSSPRATPCWSRPRAASRSRPSPPRCGRPDRSRPRAMRDRADGRGAHRRDGVAARLRLPLPEVHRLPAHPRVRAVHPRGGAGGAPREGRDADDGRHHHPAGARRSRS